MTNMRVPIVGSAGKRALVNNSGISTANASAAAAQAAAEAAQKAAEAAAANNGLANATTDQLNEGQFNLYFTNRRAQDAVASILQNTGSITWTYTGGASIKAQADLFYLMACQ